MGIPDHLTCLLRNLYVGQEATVRTGCGTMNWFQIGEGVHQGCILSPCLFNLYAEYIIWNAGLDGAQARIKLPGEIPITSDMQIIQPLWQKVKRNWKASWWKLKRRVKKLLKAQHSKNWDPGTQFHHFTANRWETMKTVTDFIFLGSKNHCKWWLQPWN